MLGGIQALPETDPDEDIQECMDSERRESAYELLLAMDGAVVVEPHDPIESERNGSHGLLRLGYGPVMLHDANLGRRSIMPPSGVGLKVLC